MEKNYSIMTDNLITLCHIVDNYKEFEERLLSVISPKYNRDFVFQLWDISRGKFKLGARKAKKFYRENKDIIDSMNKYSNVPTFINQSYGYHGEPNNNLQFFYKYLIKHRSEIDKVLAILEKLKELGFDDFELNENLDLSNEQYDIYTSFRRNFKIIYVDNIQVIPNYESYIKYGTTFSNYKMELDITGDEFSKYRRNIILNSLLFDPKKLPEKIDKQNIFDPLLKLKEEQQEKDCSIRNSVDLSISILDLETRLSYTTNTISRLEGVKNKNELLDVLLNIKQDIEKLRLLSSQYDSSVLEKDSSLTSELLEKEKTLYLKRRDWERMDLDLHW